jgi:hypothetical protein
MPYSFAREFVIVKITLDHNLNVYRQHVCRINPRLANKTIHDQDEAGNGMEKEQVHPLDLKELGLSINSLVSCQIDAMSCYIPDIICCNWSDFKVNICWEYF